MFFFPCGIQLKWEQSCKAKRIENERIVSELLLEKLIDGPIDVGGTVPETMFPIVFRGSYSRQMGFPRWNKGVGTASIAWTTTGLWSNSSRSH